MWVLRGGCPVLFGVAAGLGAVEIALTAWTWLPSAAAVPRVVVGTVVVLAFQSSSRRSPR